MNYEESGEPFLRYYDRRRQNIIKQELKRNGFHISMKNFFSLILKLGRNVVQKLMIQILFLLQYSHT
jgi:hypothetical protein